MIISGTFISDIKCTSERAIRAKRTNKSIEECPIRYGCILFAINNLNLGGQLFSIDRNTDQAFEERLILEISYKLDNYGLIIPEHKHVVALHHNPYCELKLDRKPYTKRNREFRVTNGIKSYFIKAWANNVIDLKPNTANAKEELISPRMAVRKLT